MDGTELRRLDQKHIWHPYTQMKGALEHLPVASAKGTILTTTEGKEIIDAISSWWVNPHGHTHPHIVESIYKQMQQLEHTIFAGFTHEPAVRLAHNLCHTIPYNHPKVFFSDNGSTGVEVAIKMCLQYHLNIGKKRDLFLALTDAYHGDTFGAMSVSGVGLFNAHFADHFIQVDRIPVPLDPQAQPTFQYLEQIDWDRVAGFIYEPTIQGSAGMQFQHIGAMNRLLHHLKSRGVLLIADEVMTGFGRTGKMFASQHFDIEPDIMVFSKCLTGGFLPMSITTTTQDIFNAFYDDDRGKTLMHGHSFTANPIGCAAALASLELFQKENTMSRINHINAQHQQFLSYIKKKHPSMQNPRVLGTIVALDFSGQMQDNYFGDFRNEFYTFALERGVLLRPLGNVIYMMPPYCITKPELNQVYTVWEEAIAHFTK